MYCGSDSHRTNQKDCANFCTLRSQSGHRQKSGKCPYRVCSTCGATGHSARESPYRTVGICNSCGDGPQQHHDRPRVDECEHYQGRGHIEANCPKPRCKACGRSDHRNARNFECREPKCTKCRGVMTPKGQNKRPGSGHPSKAAVESRNLRETSIEI